MQITETYAPAVVVPVVSVLVNLEAAEAAQLVSEAANLAVSHPHITSVVNALKVALAGGKTISVPA